MSSETEGDRERLCFNGGEGRGATAKDDGKESHLGKRQSHVIGVPSGGRRSGL